MAYPFCALVQEDEKITAAFALYDKNGDGVITLAGDEALPAKRIPSFIFYIERDTRSNVSFT